MLINWIPLRICVHSTNTQPHLNLNSCSIFHITLREEVLSSLKQKNNHGSLSCFHGATHLSQVPSREVEGHYSPGDEPSVTLAQLHNELSSRASTTTDDAFNNLQRSDYIHKMGLIKRNPRRIQDMDEPSQPMGQQQ